LRRSIRNQLSETYLCLLPRAHLTAARPQFRSPLRIQLNGAVRRRCCPCSSLAVVFRHRVRATAFGSRSRRHRVGSEFDEARAFAGVGLARSLSLAALHRPRTRVVVVFVECQVPPPLRLHYCRATDRHGEDMQTTHLCLRVRTVLTVLKTTVLL
jgi:hypothetical protein